MLKPMDVEAECRRKASLPTTELSSDAVAFQWALQEMLQALDDQRLQAENFTLAVRASNLEQKMGQIALILRDDILENQE